MKPYGSYVAARTLYDGVVRTMRGMDRLTGMPVLIYALPAPQEAPHLLSRRLVPYSDQGWEQGTYFLVVELPLHAVPAGDPLLAARGALEALTELHEQGQLHGGLTPAQLWAVDGDVRLAGAGLPWGPLSSGFEPPEGGKSPQADLYSLGCTLEALGGVPDPLRALLSPDPQARPSARASLALLNAPPTPSEPTHSEPAQPGEALELPGEPAAAQAVTPPEVSAPVVVGGPPAEPASVPPVVFPTIRMGFESPGEAAPSGVVAVPAAPAAPNPRQAPIRIGWEEDHSWRVVRDPEEDPAPAQPPSRARRLLGWALGLVVVLLLAGGGLWWRLAAVQPGVGASCCSVVFRVLGGGARVNITVLSAPGGSGLAKGDLLGAVPGTLQFPNAPGSYILRAEAEGYSPMQFTVAVPTTQPVEIDLKK